MSNWVALNVEPESESEEEIDDTKEIQTEEALKLYQNALKFQAQGPAYLLQTKRAYDTLFDSDIFKYPEGLSAFRRLEIGYVEPPAVDSTTSHSNDSADNGDTASNTLAQIIYLSFKNRGYAILDLIEQHLKKDGDQVEKDRNRQHVEFVLEDFSDALGRDETDVGLWRKAAKLAATLGSSRIARFCLEAVLDEDGGGYKKLLDSQGLEESVAIQDLKHLLQSLSDDATLSMPFKSSFTHKFPLKALRKQMDPFPFLPSKNIATKPVGRISSKLFEQPQPTYIEIRSLTWESLGVAISKVLEKFEDDEIGCPGTTVRVIPPKDDAKDEHHGKGRTERSSIETNGILVEEMTDHQDAVEAMPDAETPRKGRMSSMKKNQKQDDTEGDTRAGTSLENKAVDESRLDLKKGKAATSPHEVAPSDGSQAPTEISTPMQTRKRSSDSAINEDAADQGRLRSKRIRARESMNEAISHEGNILINTEQYYEDQLQNYIAIDTHMFEAVNRILRKCGIQSIGSLERLREVTGAIKVDEEKRNGVLATQDCPLSIALKDMYELFREWTSLKKNAVNAVNELDDLEATFHGAQDAGMALFLEHSKRKFNGCYPPLLSDQNVVDVVEEVNILSLGPHEIGLHWLIRLLAPSKIARSEIDSTDYRVAESTYTDYLWSDSLQKMVLGFISDWDDYIFATAQEHINFLHQRILESGGEFLYTPQDYAFIHLIQILFELFLDDYMAKKDAKNFDAGLLLMEQDELKHWSSLAGDVVQGYASSLSDPNDEPLIIRYLWATTLYYSMEDDISREHIVLCFKDIKKTLEQKSLGPIYLPNNKIMPEISVDAAEQEVSRLNTQDFILNVFRSDQDNPVSIIESLEPILEPAANDQNENEGSKETDAGSKSGDTTQNCISGNAKLQEVADFVRNSDSYLKLFLWRRLREAYQAIDYPTKVVSCHFRSIEILMEELDSPGYHGSIGPDRDTSLIKGLKRLDALVDRVLKIIMNSADPFECIDFNHIRTSLIAVSKLCLLLHSFTLYEDGVRVGQIQSVSRTHIQSFSNRLRQTYVRSLALLYLMLKEALSQSEVFIKDDASDSKSTEEHDIVISTPGEDLMTYLGAVHDSLGVRFQCELASKVFLKLAKKELLDFDMLHRLNFHAADLSPSDIRPPDTRLAQVLCDLHGLKICFAPSDLQDHGVSSVNLDKHTAIQLIDQVMMCACYMIKVQRMSLKDLLKTELKNAMEKIQNAIGSPLLDSRANFNKRVINIYLKAPINPKELYRAFHGIGELPTTPMRENGSEIAKTGWYFLQGQLNLARFTSQKRTSPAGTEDLTSSGLLFKQDLEHDMCNWECWFRYGQVFDLKVDESVLWSAEKIDEKNSDLVAHQRGAIKCYSMALAIALRTADFSQDTLNKMSDLYFAYGCRVYSASREPFSMDVFSLREYERPCSSAVDGQIYKRQPFPNLRLYAAWKFSSYLLLRSFEAKPQRWKAHYMRAKCLWKMYTCEPEVRGKEPQISYRDALDEIKTAISVLPRRRDNRQDPILEPHFKLVCLVYKLVRRTALSAREGSEILQATPYAHKVPPCEDASNWQSYILQVLKNLRTADKANWHHRMIARSAHVIYDDSEDMDAAMGAKHEFTQLFTKTMAFQIWKPEHERPGRHFVYTGRYVTFFTQLLLKLSDQTGLDALLKRVRRKERDFMNFKHIWREVLDANLKLVRRLSNVTLNGEGTLSKVDAWDWQSQSNALEQWAVKQEKEIPLMNVLREVVELKKLNTNLAPADPIEDLMIDIYAMIFQKHVPDLVTPKSFTWIGENKENKRDGGGSGATSTGRAQPSADHANEDHKVRRRPMMGRKVYIRKAEGLVNKPVPSSAITSSAAGNTSTPAHPATVSAKQTTPPPNLSQKKETYPYVLIPLRSPKTPKKVKSVGSTASELGAENKKSQGNAMPSADSSREHRPEPEPEHELELELASESRLEPELELEQGDSVLSPLHDSADDESELSSLGDDIEDEDETMLGLGFDVDVEGHSIVRTGREDEESGEDEGDGDGDGNEMDIDVDIDADADMQGGDVAEAEAEAEAEGEAEVQVITDEERAKEGKKKQTGMVLQFPGLVKYEGRRREDQDKARSSDEKQETQDDGAAADEDEDIL